MLQLKHPTNPTLLDLSPQQCSSVRVILVSLLSLGGFSAGNSLAMFPIYY